jgi:hypothetical protein
VKRLKETLEAQRESLQQFMSETAETANEVTQRAKDTVARGVLAQIRAAIDAGGPFDSAIKEFDEQVGQALPNQLRSLAEEGVQTYQELRDRFAEAARSALNAARDELNETKASRELAITCANNFRPDQCHQKWVMMRMRCCRAQNKLCVKMI